MEATMDCTHQTAFDNVASSHRNTVEWPTQAGSHSFQKRLFMGPQREQRFGLSREVALEEQLALVVTEISEHQIVGISDGTALLDVDSVLPSIEAWHAPSAIKIKKVTKGTIRDHVANA